jgi:hypothetical protein
VVVGRERREERCDFRGAHGRGMTLVMSHDEASDPVAVGLLSPTAEVPEATRVAHLVHESGRLISGKWRHALCRCEGHALAYGPTFPGLSALSWQLLQRLVPTCHSETATHQTGGWASRAVVTCGSSEAPLWCYLDQRNGGSRLGPKPGMNC